MLRRKPSLAYGQEADCSKKQHFFVIPSLKKKPLGSLSSMVSEPVSLYEKDKDFEPDSTKLRFLSWRSPRKKSEEEEDSLTDLSVWRKNAALTKGFLLEIPVSQDDRSLIGTTAFSLYASYNYYCFVLSELNIEHKKMISSKNLQSLMSQKKSLAQYQLFEGLLIYDQCMTYQIAQTEEVYFREGAWRFYQKLLMKHIIKSKENLALRVKSLLEDTYPVMIEKAVPTSDYQELCDMLAIKLAMYDSVFATMWKKEKIEKSLEEEKAIDEAQDKVLEIKSRKKKMSKLEINLEKCHYQINLEDKVYKKDFVLYQEKNKEMLKAVFMCLSKEEKKYSSSENTISVFDLVPPEINLALLGNKDIAIEVLTKTALFFYGTLRSKKNIFFNFWEGDDLYVQKSKKCFFKQLTEEQAFDYFTNAYRDFDMALIKLSYQKTIEYILDQLECGVLNLKMAAAIDEIIECEKKDPSISFYTLNKEFFQDGMTYLLTVMQPFLDKEQKKSVEKASVMKIQDRLFSLQSRPFA